MRKRSELLDTFKEIAVECVVHRMNEKQRFDLLIEKVMNNELDIYSAVNQLINVLQGNQW
jgi:hypothetical protein